MFYVIAGLFETFLFRSQANVSGFVH